MAGEEGRVFLRGVASEKYGLGVLRRAQLDAPRVRGAEVIVDDASVGHSGDSADSRTFWRVGPGDDPFLTQSLQVHFVEIAPGKANHGHGHQNEAVFYILRGYGHEIHDGERYDWGTDDLVVVHNDSHHQHFNDSDEPALALVVKAKSAWMYLGLIQQGRRGPVTDPERFGPREDWSQLWSPGVQGRRKVVRAADTTWETTRDGRVRKLAPPSDGDLRLHSVDIYQQEVPPGSRSAKHWHMADEVLYVMSGHGTSLHWEVQAEIAEKYYARIALEPVRHDITAGDVLYVPHNTVHQHFNASADEPLVFLSVSNRLFRHLGYDSVAYLEDAPEWAPAHAGVSSEVQ